MIASLALAALIAAPVVPSPSVAGVSGVTIVRQQDAASQLAGVDVFVRAGLNRETLAQSGLAALTAQAILRTPVAVPSGGAPQPLEDAMTAAGGSITFGVDSRDVHFYVEGPAGSQDTLLALFAQALAAPAFDDATVASARGELDRAIAGAGGVPFQVGMEMLDRQFFGSANEGLPQFGTPASLAQFVGDDVRGFYERYYRREGAVVSAVGPAFGSGTLERVAMSLGAGGSAPVVVKVPKLGGATRELIAHRDVSAPWMLAQFSAPPVNGKDFAPMLVLCALIDRGLQDAAQVPTAASRGSSDGVVGTVYDYDRQPASLVIYADGGMGDASTIFSNTLAFVKVINSVKLTGSFDEFKAVAAGRYVAGSDRLSDRAWLAGVFVVNGASPDYLNHTLAAIAAVTPADVGRVARAYLSDPSVALIVPRQGSAQ